MKFIYCICIFGILWAQDIEENWYKIAQTSGSNLYEQHLIEPTNERVEGGTKRTINLYAEANKKHFLWRKIEFFWDSQSEPIYARAHSFQDYPMVEKIEAFVQKEDIKFVQEIAGIRSHREMRKPENFAFLVSGKKALEQGLEEGKKWNLMTLDIGVFNCFNRDIEVRKTEYPLKLGEAEVDTFVLKISGDGSENSELVFFDKTGKAVLKKDKQGGKTQLLSKALTVDLIDISKTSEIERVPGSQVFPGSGYYITVSGSDWKKSPDTPYLSLRSDQGNLQVYSDVDITNSIEDLAIKALQELQKDHPNIKQVFFEGDVPIKRIIQIGEHQALEYFAEDTSGETPMRYLILCLCNQKVGLRVVISGTLEQYIKYWPSWLKSAHGIAPK